MASGSDENYARNLFEDDLNTQVMQSVSSVTTESIVGNRDALLAWQIQNQEINGFKDKMDNSSTDVMDGAPQNHHRLQKELLIPVQESANYAGSLSSRERKSNKNRKRRQNSSFLNKSQQGKPVMQPSNGDTTSLDSANDIHLRNFSSVGFDLEEDSAPVPAHENVTRNSFNQSERLPPKVMLRETHRGTHYVTMPKSRPHIHSSPVERFTAPNQCVGNVNFLNEELSVRSGSYPATEYDEILAQDFGRNLQMEQEQRDAELAKKLEQEERNVFRNDLMFNPNRATRNRDRQPLRGNQRFHLQRMYRDGRVRHRTPPMLDPMFLHDHDVFDPEDFVMSAMGMPRDLFGLQFQHIQGFPSQTMNFNDYEALWDLAERIGDAKSSGLSEKALSELKSFKFQDGEDEENNNCIICLSEFSNGDLLTSLNCQHTFHKKCIDTWLKRKAVCPVCRENIRETKN